MKLYTIKELSMLAGVSSRLLRYYHEINLLVPYKIDENGYRLYSQQNIDSLQEILFLRALDIPLKQIKKQMQSPYDAIQLLEKQRYILCQKQLILKKMMSLLDTSIQYRKGAISMTNEEKFTILKKQALLKQEQIYGAESRQKYGNKVIEASHLKFSNLSEREYQQMSEIEQSLINQLSKFPNIPSTTAETIFTLHKQWLQFTVPTYSSELHLSLAQMYTADIRFTEYYDQKAGKGATHLLNQIITYYISN